MVPTGTDTSGEGRISGCMVPPLVQVMGLPEKGNAHEDHQYIRGP